jgi:hypothetical protein
MLRNFKPGTTVRLTGKFLRSTGQIAGGDGSKRWCIVACDCVLCSDGCYAAVDEPHLCQSDPRGWEDRPAEERPKWRHFNIANLENVKFPKAD